MIVTINTDASFSIQQKVGGYAFYIVCNRGKILKSGQIKEAEEAEKKAKMAPDKDKLNNAIDSLEIDIPNVLDMKQESLDVLTELNTKLEGYKKWAKTLIEKL